VAVKCEWRIESSGDQCGLTARFRVSRGQRKHDAQESCRRHLALTVGALAEGQACDIIVREFPLAADQAGTR
jgi:hypothetical protein